MFVIDFNVCVIISCESQRHISILPVFSKVFEAIIVD